MIAKVNGVRVCERGNSLVMAAVLLGVLSRPVHGASILPTIVEDRVLATNLVKAVESHPAVWAAKMREEAAGFRAEGLDYTFRSPELSASTGYAQGADDVPGLSLSRVAPEDAVTVQSGVEAAVGGGLYAGAGVAERLLTDSDVEGAGDLRQTALGARVRLPLLRDFRYGLHRQEFSKLQAGAMRENAERIKKQNEVARDALLAWSDYLQGLSDMHAVENAVKRAEELFNQTSERAKLQDVAAYQVFPTQYEVALRKEELEESRQIVESRLTTLGERLGCKLSDFSGNARENPLSANKLVGDSTNDIVVIASSIINVGTKQFAPQDVLSRHPACLSAEASLQEASAARQLASEQAKDSLELSAGAGWRGESDSGFVGKDELETSENGMLEAGIVWKRSLDKRGVRSDVRAAASDREAALSECRVVQNEVIASLERAQSSWASACGRLELALSAIEDARKALTAEENRFRLGEGTSRNVLDAQKDLTTATRRGITVAAAVVDALVELSYAAGLAPVDLVATTEDRGRILGLAEEGQ